MYNCGFCYFKKVIIEVMLIICLKSMEIYLQGSSYMGMKNSQKGWTRGEFQNTNGTLYERFTVKNR